MLCMIIHDNDDGATIKALSYFTDAKAKLENFEKTRTIDTRVFSIRFFLALSVNES